MKHDQIFERLQPPARRPCCIARPHVRMRAALRRAVAMPLAFATVVVGVVVLLMRRAPTSVAAARTYADAPEIARSAFAPMPTAAVAIDADGAIATTAIVEVPDSELARCVLLDGGFHDLAQLRLRGGAPLELTDFALQ